MSVLTWTSLLLATVHAVMADMAALARVSCLPSPHQLSLLLPVLTIFLQVRKHSRVGRCHDDIIQAPLMLPWIRRKLINIRRGHVYRGIYEQKI